MLPLSAYAAAYVHFFVFYVACLCAYVLFLGFAPPEGLDTDKLDKLDKMSYPSSPPMCFLNEFRLRVCWFSWFWLLPRALVRH